MALYVNANAASEKAMPDPEEPDRPRARRPAKRREYDDDDFDDGREEGDATGGLIPYKNPKALAAYYTGVFGLISCFLLLGLFGILPIILGRQGLRYAKQHPTAKGQAHAIVGIVLGSLEVLTFLIQIGAIIFAVTQQN